MKPLPNPLTAWLQRPLALIFQQLDALKTNQVTLMTKIAEVTDELKAIDATLEKVEAETQSNAQENARLKDELSGANDKIAQLETLLANAEVPQEFADLVAGIKAHLATIDNLTPDADPASGKPA
ncbi:MAG: hypothetical protein ACOYMG_17625 [Candidatus Methylumidiphilus sp.]